LPLEVDTSALEAETWSGACLGGVADVRWIEAVGIPFSRLVAVALGRTLWWHERAVPGPLAEGWLCGFLPRIGDDLAV